MRPGLGYKKFAYLHWKIGELCDAPRSFDFDMRTFVNLNLELAMAVAPALVVSVAALRILNENSINFSK